MLRRGWMLASALALMTMPALAQDKKPTADAKADKPPADVPPPKVVVTHHVGSFGGQKVAYTATIGETYLKDDKTGEPQAAIVSTSYVKDGRDPTRPVFFLFIC